MDNTTKAIAARALGLIDLTNLNEGCTKADIDALCAAAKTKHGNTAAVCVFPAFVAQAVKALKGTGIKVATVVNFPHGGTDRRAVLAETKQVVADGADEVDLVIPYHALKQGDVEAVRAMVAMVRAATDGSALLKVIIESGELGDKALIEKASTIALSEGANFIKTSTGKVAENATLQTAEIMLSVLSAFGDPTRGFKPAGGIKTVEDCAAYLALADQIMGGGWATAKTFRFGASSVLANVLAALDGKAPASNSGGY